MQTLTQQLANPTRFMLLSGRLLPWISALACALIAMGLVMAFAAPLDYQQGHAAKIMYVHVPTAWLSMLGYVVVAASSFGLLVFRQLADLVQEQGAFVCHPDQPAARRDARVRVVCCVAEQFGLDQA